MENIPLWRFLPQSPNGHRLYRKRVSDWTVPVRKWGPVPVASQYEMGIDGDSHFHIGMSFGSPYMEPRENLNSSAKKWGRCSSTRDTEVGQNYRHHFHTGSHHTETGRESSIFPFGEPPLPNRVCFHLGINIHTQHTGVNYIFPNLQKIMVLIHTSIWRWVGSFAWMTV